MRREFLTLDPPGGRPSKRRRGRVAFFSEILRARFAQPERCNSKPRINTDEHGFSNEKKGFNPVVFPEPFSFRKDRAQFLFYPCLSVFIRGYYSFLLNRSGSGAGTMIHP